MRLFDTHAHLDDRKYDRDRRQMLKRAQDKGIQYIVNVGYDLPSSQRSTGLAEEYPFIYAAVGIHPHDASEADDEVFSKLKNLVQHPKVVAVGEMGLDYFRDLSPRDVQQQVFRRQLGLAKELGKPVIIHDRDAHGDIMKILKEEQASKIGGILHCFSGSWEMAQECLEMGFYISIAGPVTFHNARKLAEIAAKVPLNRLLIETDAPYLTPEPFRGQRNESAHVYYVAEKIAGLRKISLADLAEATTRNGLEVFGIKDHF
ncbi:MAG: TatD family hydrolase [Clostridia bacterium]|nr:TatD family hydrolase [Clostridia bacterium]